MTETDWSFSEHGGAGIEAYATPEGLWISGWYDSSVGIGAGLLSWDAIDQLRKKAKRRRRWIEGQPQ